MNPTSETEVKPARPGKAPRVVTNPIVAGTTITPTPQRTFESRLGSLGDMAGCFIVGTLPAMRDSKSALSSANDPTLVMVSNLAEPPTDGCSVNPIVFSRDGRDANTRADAGASLAVPVLRADPPMDDSLWRDSVWEPDGSRVGDHPASSEVATLLPSPPTDV